MDEKRESRGRRPSAPALIAAAACLLSGAAPAGTFFATDPVNNAVYRYRVNATGPPVLEATLTANVNDPKFLTLSSAGELFVTNGDGTVAHFLDAAGAAIPNPPSIAVNPGPHDLGFRGDELFVVDSAANEVKRFTFDASGDATPAGAVGSMLSDGGARGLTFSPSGDELFVSSCCGSQADLIHRYAFDPPGSASFTGSIGGSSNPHGMAFSPWGELFVASAGENGVRRYLFDAGGQASDNGLVQGNGMQNPISLAFSPWGELFVGRTGAGGAGVARFKFDAAHQASPNGTFPLPGFVNGIAFAQGPEPALTADVDALSLAAGGTQSFALLGGPALAGEIYFLLGSLSGTAPGVPVGGLTLPLNLDAYLLLTVSDPVASPLSNSFALLDGCGLGSAQLTLPAGLNPAFAGSTLHHAFLVFEFLSGALLFASNPVPLALNP